jgi:hypothetical protein
MSQAKWEKLTKLTLGKIIIYIDKNNIGALGC